MKNINSHKTAIHRIKPSSVAQKVPALLDKYSITSVLDFGCGYGKDIEFYKNYLLEVDGYDSYENFGYSKLPEKKYDLVVMVFVLNVLPSQEERVNLLTEAKQYINNNGYLLVSTRSVASVDKQAKIHNWEEYHDGYWSSQTKQTFQKGLNNEDLKDLFKAVGITPLEEMLRINDASVALGRLILELE